VRRTALYALGGFLVPAIVALLILGARTNDHRASNLDEFANQNFPFEFLYPDEFDAASAEGEIPALSLDDQNLITIREIDAVPQGGLSAYVAQALIDQQGTSEPEKHAGIDMVSARVPPQVTGGPSLQIYYFSTDDRTFQIDCQFTADSRRRMLKACRRAVNTIDPA
jgi:hypothetical protein